MTGEELNALRKSLRFTQGEMADAMGLALRTYTALEAEPYEEVREVHALAAAVISLDRAVERRDLNLATPRIRTLALQYARLFETGGAERRDNSGIV